jgi:hypothetical protein
MQCIHVQCIRTAVLGFVNALKCIDIHPEGCICSHGKWNLGTSNLKAVEQHICCYMAVSSLQQYMHAIYAAQ